MEYIKKYTRVILNIIIPALIVWLVIKIGPKLLMFCMPFIIGWVLSTIANPLIKFLESKVRIKRKHGSVIIICLVLAFVIIGVYFVISRIAQAIMSFTSVLPVFYSGILEDLDKIYIKFGGYYNMVPKDTQLSIISFIDSLSKAANGLLSDLATPTISVAGVLVKSIPAFLVYTVVIILSSYSFITERENIYSFFDKYLSTNTKKIIKIAKADIRKIVFGYILAQLKLMLIIAAIMFIGLLLLNVHYYGIMAILIAILDFLPVFGTGTVLIPWSIIKVLNGDYSYAVALIVIWIITQVVRQILQPKIVGDSLGLSPMLTLICLFLGFKWNGIGGMILAVPIGLIVIKLYQYGVFNSFIKNVKIIVTDIKSFLRSK